MPASCGTLAAIFGLDGSKKWMALVGRAGISRSGSGAPTASGRKKSLALREGMGGTYRRFRATGMTHFSRLYLAPGPRGPLYPFPSPARREEPPFRAPNDPLAPEVHCARHPSELRRDQPRRALDRARAGRGAGDDDRADGRHHGAGAGGRGRDTGPDRSRPEQAQQALETAIANGTATGTYVGPFGNERWVGVFGTHAAAGYGYPYPAAPDCNEASLGAGCVGDSRGFLQGQCTSWVAYRMAMRNGLSFSNWYAGMHWGNASDWNKVAKKIGHKPDKYPAVGAIGWYKRGHVSYVEDVYSNGTILISEMNTDGHNGFHFATVSPGMSSYPDKFVHLDDVVPVDTTPPTEPTDVRASAHRGRTTLTWRRSSDAWGVAGYRVFRNGARLATVRGTSYRDGNPPTGLAAVYTVVAFDAAGHASTPGRATVLPGTESADRAWVSTAVGPALCGRAGHVRRQRLGCRLLVEGGWREVALSRTTMWGEPSTRAFLPSPDGSVSYCRAIGRSARALSCTALDPDARSWGADRTSSRTPRLLSDATWVTTPTGPARCGLTGSVRRPTATCTVLSAAGWRTDDEPWPRDQGRRGEPRLPRHRRRRDRVLSLASGGAPRRP